MKSALFRVSRRTRLWWGTGLALALAVGLLGAMGIFGCLRGLLILGLVAWSLLTLGWLLVWLWRRLTYRISVRLLISYLLIGVVPIPLVLALLAGGGYVLVGQYTSASLGALSLQLQHGLGQWTAAAIESGESSHSIDLPDDLDALEARAGWLLATGGQIQSQSAESLLEIPEWVEEGKTSGHFLTATGPVLASIERRGERIASAWIPLDKESSRAISRGRWFEAAFLPEPVVVKQSKGQFSFETVHVGGDDDGQDGEPQNVDDSELFKSFMSGEGLLGRRWIFFMRLSPEPRAWLDGATLESQSVPTVLNTSPREAVSELFSSPYRIGPAVAGVLMFLAGLGAVVYVVALALATAMVVAITRSTARLTRGARQVEEGDLQHRIGVHRRDQLGDLANAFNRMTESVEGMLADVAEKERLKKELELAREIQQRLLPPSTLRHGSLVVRAHFQPAEEVGGDYFDLFPLEDGKLIVAVGDVAGHGLPTGLLMAMVKSAVATLIREGHRGEQLLEKLNEIMLEQPREHRMVTFAVAEIDVEGGTATITNAAHPPLFLTGEGVREVMLPALPIGFPWRHPPASTQLDLSPGARLIFYSDGLVEALDPEDEPFGYERLQELLGRSLDLPTDELLRRILDELDGHTAGRPLDDDLTILIIDCGSSAED